MGSLHLACNGESVVVGRTWHAYHQVYVCGLEHLVGLIGGGHLREGGRVSHAQLHILVEDLLVYAAVVFQHEGVIGVCHYQHAEYAPCHQVYKRHVLQVELVPLMWYFCCLFHCQ